MDNIITIILLIMIIFMILVTGYKHYTANEHNLEQFTQSFDTKWYINDPNKTLIINNKIDLPIIRYGSRTNGSYEQKVGEYFKHHIYPITITNLVSGLDTIYKFINNNIDIVFINEELLAKYIDKGCKYLTNNISSNLEITNPEIDKLYPPINFSAIGVGFYEDFYFIVNYHSNIIEFLDIKISTKTIGILADSYYYFIKLCAAYELDITKLKVQIEQTLEQLIYKFKINTYDGIFVVIHPKHQQILDMTLNVRTRFIHLQPRENTLFNKKIKKYFETIIPRTVDLNKFHKTENTYSYLNTYSIRMILVIRNDIPTSTVEYITRNYIDNLAKLRSYINTRDISSLEFNYNELVSFNNKIPLSTGARNVYIEEGLIKLERENTCNI